MVGISQTKATFNALAELAADAIVLVRHGVGLGSLGKLLEILGDVKALAECAPNALPELKEIDQAEAAELAAAAYQAIRKILEAVKG